MDLRNTKCLKMCLCNDHSPNSNNDNVKKSKNQENAEQPASVFMRFWSQRGLTPEQHDILSPSLALCMNHSLSLLHLHTHTFAGTLCWHVFQTEWQPLYPSAKSRAPPKQSQKPIPKTQCKAHKKKHGKAKCKQLMTCSFSSTLKVQCIFNTAFIFPFSMLAEK